MLAVASVPIAVAANSLRIVGTGLLVQYWDPEKAEGFFHAGWGWIIFVISLTALYLLHRLAAGNLARQKRGQILMRNTTRFILASRSDRGHRTAAAGERAQ